MPRVPVSEGNRVGLQPLPDTFIQATDQDSVGRAIGEGAAQLGRTGQQFVNEQAERQEQVDRASLATDTFALQQRISSRVLDARNNAAAGAAGHEEAVRQIVQEETQPFLEGIRNRTLRREFQQRMAAIGTSTMIAEGVYASHERVLDLHSTADEARNHGVNGIMTNPTPQNFQLTRDTLHGVVDAMTAVPESDRREMRTRIDQETAAGYVVGEGRNNPGAALATLRSGIMDQYLSPEQRRSLETTMDTAQRQRISTARSAAQSQIDVFQGRLHNHDQTITDADIAQMGQLAQAAGIPVEAFNLATARVMHQVDTQFRNSTSIEIRNEIGTLNTRIGQAGDHASPDDVVRRDHLQTLLTQRDAEMQHDPSAIVERRGATIPPLDGTPASVQGRVQAMRTVFAQTGSLQFYRPQEAEILRNRAASGAGGMLATVNEVAAIGNYDPQMMLAAAEQVAPNNPAFRHATRVPPYARALVVRGAEARHLLPPQMTDATGEHVSFDNVTQAWFAAHVAPSLVTSQPEFQRDVLESSRNIYAELRRQSSTGGTGAEVFSEANFAGAVNLALGRTSHGGGLASWGQGPRAADGNPQGFLLPTGMPQREFEERMANLPLARTGGHWPAGSINAPPSDGHGGLLSADALRSQFVPVAISDGVYQFHNGNQIAMAANGQPFQLTIRNIPPLAHRRIAVVTYGTPPVRNAAALPAMHSSGSPDPTLSPEQYRALHPHR